MLHLCSFKVHERRVAVACFILSFKLRDLESYGISCEHLVVVMMHLNIVNLPETVVYKRWTKTAKDYVDISRIKNECDIDLALVAQYVGFMHHCKRLAESAFKCWVARHIRETIDILSARSEFLDEIRSGDQTPDMDVDPVSVGGVKNPARVRTNGCGGTTYCEPNRGQSQRKERRVHCYRVCGDRGHNRVSCPVQVNLNLMSQTHTGPTASQPNDDVFMAGHRPNAGLYHDDESSDDNDEYFYANVDMVNHYMRFNLLCHYFFMLDNNWLNLL